MKILFLTDEFYPEFGANTLIVKTLCEEFIKEKNEVYVMPFNYLRKQKQIESWRGINILRVIPNDDMKSMLSEMKQLHILQCTKLLFKYCSMHFLKLDKLEQRERIVASRILREWIQKEKIDVVISICCSIELSFPLYRLRKRNQLKCKWIFYMLDPFETHSYYKTKASKSKLRSIQHKIMKECDKVVLTELIYNDVAKWETPEIIQKLQIIEFPKISNVEKKKCDDEIIFKDGYINIVCTGSKNELVRNSEYSFDLIQRFQHDKIAFHFIGIGWTDKKVEKKGNIYLYSPRSWESIQNAQAKADFLLNIGNIVTNQLPSKILEYIGSGHPILNIYKSDECPTLKLLEGYDVLNINETKETLVNSEMLMRQYIYSEHKRTSYEKIKKEYEKYTPEYVSTQFLRIMNDNERV